MKKLHDWAKAPFERLTTYLAEANEFAEAVEFGLSNTKNIVGAEEYYQGVQRILKSEGNDMSEKDLARLEFLRTKAEKADSLIDNGLPLLTANMTIGLWVALEAAIDDVFVSWISNVPSALSGEELCRIKVPLGKLQSANNENLFEYVLEEYKQTSKARLKLGVDRFQVLLDAIGLSGDFDRDKRRDIFELSQIRNVLLHKAGYADNRLINRCPWLELSEGQKVCLEKEDVLRFGEAVTKYSVTVVERMYKNTDAYAEIEPSEPLEQPEP